MALAFRKPFDSMTSASAWVEALAAAPPRPQSHSPSLTTTTYHRRGLGYLAENQFEQLLREKTGLSLNLSDREIKLIVEEVHDGSGAFEPQMLSKFISVHCLWHAAQPWLGTQHSYTHLHFSTPSPMHLTSWMRLATRPWRHCMQSTPTSRPCLTASHLPRLA